MGRPGRSPGARDGAVAERGGKGGAVRRPSSLPPGWEVLLRREWRRLIALEPSEAPLSARELDRAAADLLTLQRGLTSDRRLVGDAYMEDPALLGAYLLWYWPASYLQVGRALGRSLESLEASFPEPSPRSWLPRRVLDLGAGPGPASAAFLDRGARDILAMDHSPRALSLLVSLLGGYAPGALTQGRAWTAGQPLPPGPFDAVVVSHALNEMGQAKSMETRIAERADAVEGLLGRVEPPGFVLIVEPALLLTSRDLLSLRDELLRRGRGILAPCLWKGPCPALLAGETQTCHDAFPWVATAEARGLAERTGLDRAELKMAWMAVRAEPVAVENAMSALSREVPTPSLDAGRVGRRIALVVSDAMLNKAGRTRYMLCGPQGRYSLSARLSDLGPSCGAFNRLRRMDRIAVEGAEARGEGGLGLTTGSRLSVLERSGAAG